MYKLRMISQEHLKIEVKSLLSAKIIDTTTDDLEDGRFTVRQYRLFGRGVHRVQI